MKNSMKKAIALLAVLVLVFSLTGCGSSVVGTWTAEESGVTMDYTFEKNGDCSIAAMGMTFDGTYEVKGDKISMTLDAMGTETTEEYTFKVSGKELTLTLDGESIVFKKK